MKVTSREEHPAASFFSLILFGIFVLFLLMMLLFGARIYQSCVEGLEENNNLHTARAYVTAKFHEHDDNVGGVFLDNIQGLDALCFLDEIDGVRYQTSIYLQGNQLKELFAREDSSVSPDMGTVIADLKDFQAADRNGILEISMSDKNGKTSCFILHPGPTV